MNKKETKSFLIFKKNNNKMKYFEIKKNSKFKGSHHYKTYLSTSNVLEFKNYFDNTKIFFFNF